MSGITLDTGALIALERRRPRMRHVVESAVAQDRPITVPANVLAEWWRGRSDVRESILAYVDVERFDARLAKLVGLALGSVGKATMVDAIVMASAASRGDVVYTADVEDLERLRRYFPGVRVLGI